MSEAARVLICCCCIYAQKEKQIIIHYSNAVLILSSFFLNILLTFKMCAGKQVHVVQPLRCLAGSTGGSGDRSHTSLLTEPLHHSKTLEGLNDHVRPNVRPA